MKKIIKISILSLVIVFAGCTDLVEEPVGVLAPEGFYKSPADIQIMTNGAYGTMASSNFMGSGLPITLQLLSDMADVGINGNSSQNAFNDFSYTSLTPYIENIWQVGYAVIAIANSAIDGAQSLQVVPEEEDARSRAEAEARFVRAFTYYHLVRLFGALPYIGSSQLSGESLATIDRMPAAQVYDKIIADLEYASANLTVEHPLGLRSRPSQGTARSVLSSVYLTLGNWQAAYDNAKWVIDNAGALDYALESDYQDLFRQELQDNMREYIFTVDFTFNVRSGGNGTLENDNKVGPYNGVSGGAKPYRGWGMVVPHQNVYDTWDANDYRRKVSFDDSLMVGDDIVPYTSFPKTQRPHIAKWTRFPGETKGKTAGWRSDLDYPYFRYAEVLLIAAEAANELGNTAEAVGYVNQLRARARAGGNINFDGNGYGSYPPSASPADIVGVPSQSAFRDMVLEERRIELSFEFKRWYDIVRRDLGGQAFGPGGLEPQPGFESNKYLLPIPQSEVDLNPNLGQNPGY